MTTYNIRQLEWIPIGTDGKEFMCKVPPPIDKMWHALKDGRWHWRCWGNGIGATGKYRSLEEAQAVCQSDFESRLLPSLEEAGNG